jgi:hypothetical protein
MADPGLFLIISSTDSDKFFAEENSSHSFKVKLYKPLNLDGKWEIGLLSCIIEGSNKVPKSMLMQSHICESHTVVGGIRYLPIVKQLTLTGKEAVWTFESPSYIKVKQAFIETLDIYITELDGITPALDQGETRCTLHLRPCE